MSYLGNSPDNQTFLSGTDYFSGNGSTVLFTLSRQITSINDIIVVVENVVQYPGVAYSVIGNQLTFTGTPPSGTNNIYVRYMSVNTRSIGVSDGAITTPKIQDASVTSSKLATGSAVSNIGYTPVNKAGDSMTGRLTVTTSGADGIVLNTDVADATTSSRLFLKTNSDAGSIYYDANGFALNTGATLINTSGTKRFGVDTTGRVTVGGAGSMTGVKVIARQGGLSCTNSANELSGYVVFNARIQSGTNFVIASATGINSESMITAKVQYINIYDWSNSTIFHQGSRMAAIRSSSGGGTTATSFSLGSLNSGSTSATEPTFVWTGTTTLNLNLTGASSNEGVAVISIAWRGCSIAISPST